MFYFETRSKEDSTILILLSLLSIVLLGTLIISSGLELFNSTPNLILIKLFSLRMFLFLSIFTLMFFIFSISLGYFKLKLEKFPFVPIYISAKLILVLFILVAHIYEFHSTRNILMFTIFSPYAVVFSLGMGFGFSSLIKKGKLLVTIGTTIIMIILYAYAFFFLKDYYILITLLIISFGISLIGLVKELIQS